MNGKLDYWRADNMWAAEGRPDGPLGKESISLPMGATQVFFTDWKYEKKRNDGRNYYGSHGRVLHNVGTIPVDVKLVGSVSLKGMLTSALKNGFLRVSPGQKVDIKNDIAEVRVPKT